MPLPSVAAARSSFVSRAALEAVREADTSVSQDWESEGPALAPASLVAELFLARPPRLPLPLKTRLP